MAEMTVELVAVERRVWSGRRASSSPAPPSARSASCRGTSRRSRSWRRRASSASTGSTGRPPRWRCTAGSCTSRRRRSRYWRSRPRSARRSTSPGRGRRVSGPTSRNPRVRRRGARPGAAQSRGRRVGGAQGGNGVRRRHPAAAGCLCLDTWPYGGYGSCGAVAWTCACEGRAGRRPVASRDAAAGWHVGVGRYRGNEFAWYRLTRCGPGPPPCSTARGGDRRRRHPDGRGGLRDAPGGVGAALPDRASGELELAMTPGVLPASCRGWSPPRRPAGYRAPLTCVARPP